jgi:MFS family permease
VASVTALAVVGILSDRIGGRAILGLSLSLLAVATLAVHILDDTWTPVVYGLLLGAAGGTGFAAEGVLFPRYFGIHAIAAIRGLAFTVSIAAAAVGPVLVGVLRGASDGYGVAAIVLLAMPVTIGIAAIVIREPRGVLGTRAPDEA